MLPPMLALALAASGAGAATVPAPKGPPVVLSLPDAVLIGLRKNRTIRSDYLQRIADRFALYVAEDIFTPKADLVAAVSRARNAGSTSTNVNVAPNLTWNLPTGAVITGGLTNTQFDTKGQTGSAFQQLNFQVIQPLLRGAGSDYATATLRTARLQEKANKLRLKQTVIDTVTKIVTSYRSVIQNHEQVRIAEEGLKRARELLEINRVLITAGRLAQVELVQSEASIAAQELQVTSARNDYEAAKLALLTLLALDSGTQIETVNTLSATPVRIDEGKALQVAYERQPNYLSQLIAIEVAKISVDVAKNQRQWDVSIVAGGGQQGSGSHFSDTYGSLRSSRMDYTAGVQLSIPLHDPTREQREVAATVALRQAELQSDQLHDQTGQQVRDAVRTVASQGSQLALARRSRELSAAQLETELVKLRAGRSSNFQVVSFQNSLQQAESTELTAIIAYLNALTTFDQVVGTTLETWRITLNDEQVGGVP